MVGTTLIAKAVKREIFRNAFRWESRAICLSKSCGRFFAVDHYNRNSTRGYYDFLAGALLVSGSIFSSHDRKSECSTHHEISKNNIAPIHAQFIEDINSVYKIEEVIGEGGFGKDYRHRRIKDGKKMALKFISKAYSLRDDFQREIEALRKLNFDDGGHPHICKMYDIFEGENVRLLSFVRVYDSVRVAESVLDVTY